MTVSARCSPLAFFRNDVTVFREFPYEFANGDPGRGSGGSSSIAVELTPGNVGLAWMSYGNPSVQNGAFPPPGFGYPAQPSQAQLASALRWWPQGFHNYGGVSWSRNFGFVASYITGLLPTGEVVPANFCFPFVPNNDNPRWTLLGYSSAGNDGKNPYSGNANAWLKHFGYDLKRRKDIVCWESSKDYGTEYLQIYEISRALPSVRETKIWQGTDGDRALRRTFKVSGGQQFVQIPWLGVWWVTQIAQGSLDSNNSIWGFAPSARPESASSSAPAGFDVPIPPEVKSRSADGNLHLVVDQMGRRVFAYQADTSRAPTSVDGVPKYPLVIYEVNPTTYAWTPVSLHTQLLVAIGGKLNVAPMAYFGGSRFVYFDQRDAASASWGSEIHVSGNPIPGQSKRTGGFHVREIFIPKANPPRTMTWTQRTWRGSSVGLFDWHAQKHVEMAFNSTNGKIYCFGGDHGGFVDSTLDGGSYTNQVISFSPESGADLALRSPACPARRSISHPIRVDENGFQYRPSSNNFWMMAGYSAGNWTNQCGWANAAEWTSAGGSNLGIWTWSDASGWTRPGPMTPKPGFAGRVWTQGEDHCRRWYYDAGADKLLAAAYGSGADRVAVPTVQILDCIPNPLGQYEFAKYNAGVCSNGQSGDVRRLPDGRPYIDTVMGANSMWRSDRAAVDPATGHMYVHQPATGDVFRIHTRAGFWTFEGLPAARVEWVCRTIPSGTRSLNLAHFIWAKNALWMFFQSSTGRLRAFSWANGEEAPIEHPTPEGAVGTSVAKYTVGLDERICVIGNQTRSSWSSLLQSKLLHYYTITLA